MVKWIWCARGLSQTNPWTFNDCCIVFGIGLCLLCTSSSHQQTHPGIVHGESWSVHAQTQARHHWGAADEGPSSWGEKQATNGEVRKWWWCLGGREWIMKVYFYSLQCVLSALRKDCQEMMFFFLWMCIYAQFSCQGSAREWEKKARKCWEGNREDCSGDHGADGEIETDWGTDKASSRWSDDFLNANIS